MTQQHPEIKAIKHEFMAYRNGIVADALRKAGQPYSIIFGLQLPQLSRIASNLAKSPELARELWRDKNIRESRLLAAWVFPPEELSKDEAEKMALDVLTREEADIISFRLLKKLPFAKELATGLQEAETSLQRYVGEALMRNLEC